MKPFKTKRTFPPVKLEPHQYLQKGKLIRRLLKELGDYYRAFNQGMAFEIVNRKFNRGFMKLGGIRDTIEQLEMDGSVQMIFRVSGRYELFPADTDLESRILDLKLADAVQIRIIG